MGNWVHRLTNVDVDKRTATCTNCGPVSIKVEKNRSPVCRTRVNEAAARYRSKRKTQRDRYYAEARAKAAGATLAQVEEARDRQGGLCAICRKPSSNSRDLHRDHSHATGNFRGLLCHRCNVGLGYFLDSPDLLSRAAQYLRNAKAATTNVMTA